jgi:hypothetical protein
MLGNSKSMRLTVKRIRGLTMVTVASIIVFGSVLPSNANAESLRFFGGNSSGDVDRVKIQIDDPSNNNAGPPADIGAEDFTVDLWIKSAAGNNEGTIACQEYNFVWGNIILDRDRLNQGRAFGISLTGGRVTFSVQNQNFSSETVCSSSDLRDNAWHHIAVQRRFSDGRLWLYVDGVLEDDKVGPTGDISYPDSGNCNDASTCANSDHFLVFGAEKHDIASGFSGWIDEVRLSNVLRYPSESFPSQPFVPDQNTVGLYHFDEGSGNTIGDSAPGGASPGIRRFGVGGGSTAGPAWSADAPFVGQAPGTLQLSSANYSVNEITGSVDIVVTRSGGSDGAASVSYATSDGTAMAGSDYSAATGNLSWTDADASQRSIMIPILNDSDVEGDEAFEIILSNVVGANSGVPSSATVAIVDDDVAPNPGALQFSRASYEVNESSGSVAVTVARVGGSSGMVTVDSQTGDGSATGDVDFQRATSTLSWSDGDMAEKAINITILDDTNDEPDESLTLILSNPTGGVQLPNPADVPVTILDDDSPQIVSNPSSGGGVPSPVLLGMLVLLSIRNFGVRIRG